VQYEPSTPYTEEQVLVSFAQDEEIEVLSGQPAVDLFKGGETLPSTPGGELSSQITATKTKVAAEWSTSRDANYTAD
ncbi:MAG: hypothetical protein L0Y56_20055, partial [Nitrospira sp.]|nr:hypothetical protein [Nitrospira sp.]